MRFNKKKSKGFSLVELMIVVSIIGILAALAVPRFQGFQAKARSAESKTSLAHIFTLEASYNGDTDSYGNFQQIGFTLNGVTGVTTISANPAKKIRYGYSFQDAHTLTTYRALATAASPVLGTCQTADQTATVDQNKLISLSPAGGGITGC